LLPECSQYSVTECGCNSHCDSFPVVGGWLPVKMQPENCFASEELVLAAKDGNFIRLRAALSAGADVKAQVTLRPKEVCMEVAPSKLCKGEGGSVTALMAAAGGGHLRCVTALLEARAGVNALDEAGRRALHYAVASGNYEVGSALVCAGADRTASDVNGQTALDYTPSTCNGDEVERWGALLALPETFSKPVVFAWEPISQPDRAGKSKKIHTERKPMRNVLDGASAVPGETEHIANLLHAWQQEERCGAQFGPFSDTGTIYLKVDPCMSEGPQAPSQ